MQFKSKDIKLTYNNKIIDELTVKPDNSVVIKIGKEIINLPANTADVKLGGRPITPYLSAALIEWDVTVPLITYKEDEALVLEFKQNMRIREVN